MATQTSPKTKHKGHRSIPKIVVEPDSSPEREKNDDGETMKMKPPHVPISKSKVGPSLHHTEVRSEVSQLSQVKKTKKVAVTHGHSMANWMTKIKNESLVPVTNRAISTEELLKHNTRNDCWMALRGKVFDVTDYGEYHPGGVTYLMKGAGLDASKMFNNIHNYVNFESILKGRQVGMYMPTSPEKSAKGGGGGGVCCNLCNGKSAKDENMPITAFDQDDSTVEYKVECTNANVEVNYWSMGITDGQNLMIRLVVKPPEIWIANLKLTKKLNDSMLRFSFENQFKKMVLTLQKPESSKWKSIGTPQSNHNKIMNSIEAPADYYPAKIIAKDEIGPGHFLYAISTGPEVHFGFPVAWVLMFKIGDVEKPYTPVKFITSKQQSAYDDLENDNPGQVLYFLIRNFKKGKLTSQLDHIPLRKVGHLEIGGVRGSFDTDMIVDFDRILFVAGGTGIAPFVTIIKHIKDKRRDIKVSQVVLIQSAHTSNDILWKDVWESLVKTGWFFYIPYVTHPTDDWTGAKNRISVESVTADIKRIPHPSSTESNTKLPINTFAMACGPSNFTETCKPVFDSLGIPDEKVKMFLG